MTTPPPTILHVFPTFAVGGAQIRFAMLANAMGAALRHRIISLDGRKDTAARLDPGLDVGFIDRIGAKNAFLASIAAYRRMLRDLRPDILMTYNWGAIEFAFANLLPLTRHVHVVDGFGSDEFFRRLRRRCIANRIALRNSVTVVPSMVLRDIATREWSLPEDRVRYIPNGIDLSRFAPSPPRPADQPVVIGTVAALRPEKNVARLILAFARLPASVRLHIVGDGECRASLERLAGGLELGDRVAFLGYSDAIPEHLAGWDVFALSSDTEQMPIGVLEAMAAGLPVASTDVGDVRHMVAEENAALVAGKDAGSLAASLRALVDDAGLRVRLGAANRVRAERVYDQATMFAAWRDLLDGVLATPVAEAA